MRPLKLSLQAFGPFAGKEVIDFTAFGDNAFFLIHGPTGAGKTSILDGICYALYGAASGFAREEHTLRSHHAPPELPCEVEFTFRVGPRHFFIRRTPEQTLVKSGREQKTAHRVEMCEIDQAGALIGGRLTRVREVDEKVEEILGFTADQFRQVVILPQGEFRRLLLASSTEKEKILEKLFATERFKRIETMLKERRDSLSRDLEGIRNTMRGILEGQGAASPEELAQRCEELQVELSRLARAGEEAASRLATAAEALQQGTLTAEKFRRLERARTALHELGQRKEEMERERERGERGRRALALADLDDARSRERARLESVTRTIERLEEELVRIGGELSVARGERDALKERAGLIPAKTAEKLTLEQRLGQLADLAALEKQAQAKQSERDKEAAALEALQGEMTRTEENLASLTREIERLTLTAGKRGELEQRLKEAGGLLQAAQELADAELRVAREAAEREKLAAASAIADERFRAASATCDEMTKRFVQGQAAILARGLSDGHPCPVCGSTAHPSPAVSDGQLPTEEELEAARRELEKARQRSDGAKRTLHTQDLVTAEARAALESLRFRLGEHAGRPLDELRRLCQTLQGELETVRADEARLAALRTEREGVSATLESLRRKLPLQTARLAEASSSFDTLQGQLLAKRAEIADDGRDETAIRKGISLIERFIADTTRRLEAREEAVNRHERDLAAATGRRDEALQTRREVEERLHAAQERFAARLVQAGFETEEEYRLWRISPQELEEIEKKSAAYRDRMTAAVAEFEQADAACEGLTPPDLEALTAAKRDAEDEVRGIDSRRGSLETRIETVRQALSSLESYRRESDGLERQYRVVGNLANLASGNNPKRITLQRFVLATLFEEVALAASARLSRMSRGRYHLRRAEEVTSLRKSGGLDLEVTDDFTGLHRPASSLSGGETFLASLSLALGLSDVVLAQSGGRYLDTLFIDEGFGTLDPETLDIAMETLFRLNEQGRMIGIISHVTELKEQIPTRLEIEAQRNGSRIRMIC